MSRSKDAYIDWAERQFEQTGIENDYFSPSGGGSVNPFKKYKRDTPELTPEAIAAFKEIERSKRDQHSNFLTPESIAAENKLIQYHKDCETMPEAEARVKYLTQKKQLNFLIK